MSLLCSAALILLIVSACLGREVSTSFDLA